jgi:hypothetical protein
MPHTIVSRPQPQRPSTGLLAWQATIGYLRYQYDLNAVLSVEAHPAGDDRLLWDASAAWGQITEKVTDKYSLPAALRDLWHEVKSNYLIFDSAEAVVRSPANYADDEWLDPDTQKVLYKTIDMLRTVYSLDWTLAMVYQPVEIPAMRFQADLISNHRSVQLGGHGPTLIEACRDLYRSAAHRFLEHTGKKLSDLD